MLLSTKDQGLGRRRRSYSHSHVYSMNKAARSSRFSLLSAVTSQSSGSNGSNSTVTQESYNKTKGDTGRKKKVKRKKEVVKVKLAAMEALEEAVSEAEDQQEEIDVFAFLVDDEARQQDNDGHDEVTETATEQCSAEKGIVSQSLHSDSGISMDEGSIAFGQATAAPLLPTTPEYRHEGAHEPSPVRLRWTWPDVPRASEPRMLSGNLEPCDDIGASPTKLAQTYPALLPPIPERQAFPDQPMEGHENFIPRYGDARLLRSFTHTSRRMLVEMQQEIVGLEDEIKRIEEHLQQFQQHTDTSSPSAARRGSWDWYQQPQELHAMRADIVARLQSKLEQYYRLVMLSQKIESLKASSPASADEINVHRKSIKAAEGVPLSDRDGLLRLLSRDDDLIMLSNQTKRLQTLSDHLRENAGRMLMASGVLFAAVCLQIAQDLCVKALLVLQMLSLLLGLCLWKRL